MRVVRLLEPLRVKEWARWEFELGCTREHHMLGSGKESHKWGCGKANWTWGEHLGGKSD